MIRKSSSLILVLAMICILFTACASPATTASSAPASSTPASSAPASTSAASSAAPEKVVDICTSMTNAANFYASKVFQEKASDYNLDLTVMDSKNDPAIDAQNINTCIAQGAKAFFINPNDMKAIVPSLMAAKQAGLVVCLFSTDVAEDQQKYRDFCCSANDIEAGKLAAEAFIKQFPNGANIVEVGGKAGHAAAMKRHDGFTEALKGSNIKVIDSQYCQEWDTNMAMNIMQDFITKDGDKIQGVFCHWDTGLTGCIQALQNAKMDPAKLFTVGIDGCQVGYDQVKAGTQSLCLGQDFGVMADTSLQLCRKVLDGQKVDSVNYIPWVSITKDTIGSITRPEW